MSEQTKSEMVAQELRRRVLSGQYPRATRLRQDQLAVDFGVSITPVREALRLLESEKLLVALPHRGVQVADVIDVESIRASYVLRRLAETFAIGKALRRLSPVDFDALLDLLTAEEGGAADPGPAAAESNKRFHFYFYERCGMPPLTAEIERMWASFPWDLMLSSPARRVQSRVEHRAILDAALAGDPSLLTAAFEAHLASGMASICEHLTGSPGVDPFDVP